MRRAAVTLALALALALGAGRARADAPARPAKATFALIVGANQSVDANLAPLKYADDDAARYLDLFRLLGARTYLLSRLDDNTRRLHPQAAAEAEEPKRAPFDRAVAQLAADVAQANQRGVETVVYFVYAGHGNVKDGQGYITLEDARITGGELSQVVQKIPAARVHLVVDACASYFLAYSRGPGGERRALEGFRASALTQDPRVGVLLSTSSARE
ncbi:MAG: caspase family protein, partial [Myxococcales bacterium]|nr:caspase family protein [Myxococcales bacterium]